MQVCLYGSQKDLPFSDSPKNPVEFFDPMVHREQKIRLDGGRIKISVTHLPVWPLLLGLHTLGIQLLAHVYSEDEKADNGKSYVHSQWIQLTSLAVEYDQESGLPTVVKNGRVMVGYVFEAENRVISPYRYFGTKQRLDVINNHNPEFWRNKFTQELKRWKKLMQKEHLEHMAEWEGQGRIFPAIPD